MPFLPSYQRKKSRETWDIPAEHGISKRRPGICQGEGMSVFRWITLFQTDASANDKQISQ
jgi:hypothetical protein